MGNKMGCLSPEQLVRLALGLAADAELTAHVEQCAACRRRLEAMQSVRLQLAETYAKFDHGHGAARKRLLALLPAANPPSAWARSWNRISQQIGGFTMRQWITAAGGVGVAALLGLILLWGGIDTKPVSAMEKMAESIRHAKSYKAAMTVEGKATPVPGKPPVKNKLTGTVCWLASGSSRSEFRGLAPPSSSGGPSLEADVTKIDLPDQSREGASTETIIDHKAKTFHKVDLPKGFPGGEMVAKLGDFSGQADRDLGTKEIDGKKARGFEIDMKKLFPDRVVASHHDTAEIWIDTESSLPILVQFKMTNDRSEQTLRLQDFQWNIYVDPKLFDTTLPKGYTDVTSSFPVPPKSSAARPGTK
jgi:hypothetical protein